MKIAHSRNIKTPSVIAMFFFVFFYSIYHVTAMATAHWKEDNGNTCNRCSS